MKKTLLALSLSCFLAACGSSDGDSSSGGDSGNPPSTSVLTGVLTDGPVSNVRYETSSGLSGTTNAAGEYEYKAGDTVSFYLGTLKLGSTAAKAHVTPVDLSDNAIVRTNLLMLLQSLDSDQNHSNGISISDAVIAALKDKTIDLSLPTATFQQDATLTQILSAAGLTLVSEETAKKNFFEAFVKDHAGAWILEDKNDNSKVLLYLDSNAESADGTYTISFYLGEDASPDSGGQPGIEQGKLNWDPITGQLSRAQDFTVDTNGDWGFSDILDGSVLTYGADKNTLAFKEGSETHTFKKAENKADSVIGTWVRDGLIIHLASDSTFMVLSTENDDCASPGIETGTYLATATTIKSLTAARDTTGCSGLIDTWGSFAQGQYELDTFTLNLNGNSLTLQYTDGSTGEAEDPITFSRK